MVGKGKEGKEARREEAKEQIEKARESERARLGRRKSESCGGEEESKAEGKRTKKGK